MREPYALRRFLSTKLDFNEDVLAWGRGTLERESDRLKGVLVATDRRIAFYGEQRLRGVVSFHEIPVRMMTRVEVGDADSSLEIEGPHRVIRFTMQRREEFEFVRSALEELREVRTNGAVSGEPKPEPPSASDETNAEAARAPEDAGSAEAGESIQAARAAPVEFSGIIYIRGLRGLVQPTEGRFLVGGEAVEFHVGRRSPEVIPLADITAVEVLQDTRLLPAGEKNRSAVLRLAATQSPSSATSLPLGTRAKLDTVTIWYLSISFRSAAESGVALFSVSSWGSAEKKASEIVDLIKRNRSLASSSGADGAEPAHATGEDTERRPSGQIRERLVQLKELYESDLISEAEYAAKRRELLAEF